MRQFVAAALLLFAAPAYAGGVPQWCLEGLDDGDAAYVDRMTTMLLSTPKFYSADDIEKAIECLNRHTGKSYSYNAVVQRFGTKEELDGYLAEKAKADQKKAEAAAAKAAAEKEAAAAAEKARAELEQIRADIERRAAERQQAVVARLSDACDAMFRRDADATITNKLCFDVFWERGLPE